MAQIAGVYIVNYRHVLRLQRLSHRDGEKEESQSRNYVKVHSISSILDACSHFKNWSGHSV